MALPFSKTRKELGGYQKPQWESKGPVGPSGDLYYQTSAVLHNDLRRKNTEFFEQALKM